MLLVLFAAQTACALLNTPSSSPRKVTPPTGRNAASAPRKVATLEPPATTTDAPREVVEARLERLLGSTLDPVEAQIERLTRDPQLLLEAVVGLPGNQTAYDRDTPAR